MPDGLEAELLKAFGSKLGYRVSDLVEFPSVGTKKLGIVGLDIQTSGCV